MGFNLSEEISLYLGKRELQRHSSGDYYLISDKEKMINDLSILKENLGFILLIDIIAIDNIKRRSFESIKQKRFEIIYLLLNLDKNIKIRVQIDSDEFEKIPSVHKLWKNAIWPEKEIWDLFGIDFSFSDNRRFLLSENFVGHPLRKDFSKNKVSGGDPLNACQENDWTEISSAHPGIRGGPKIKLNVDNDIIVEKYIEIGQTHRCFEKLCEQKTYQNILPLVERLNFCSGPLNAMGWCKAIEDAFELEVSEKVMTVRMIIGEFSRIADHLLSLGMSSFDLGLSLGQEIMMEARDSINFLFEEYMGTKIFLNFTKIGGLTKDLPDGWMVLAYSVLRKISQKIKDIDRILTRNKIFMKRLDMGLCEIGPVVTSRDFWASFSEKNPK